MKCETCRYFDRYTDESSTGLCRRYPPHAEYGQPEVRAEAWCGEFKAKPLRVRLTQPDLEGDETNG